MRKFKDIYKKLPPLKIFACIDIHCEIQAVPFAQLSQMQPGEPSEKIRERVIAARKIQTERFSSLPKQGGLGRVYCNAMMTERMLHQFAEPDAASLDILPLYIQINFLYLHSLTTSRKWNKAALPFVIRQ